MSSPFAHLAAALTVAALALPTTAHANGRYPFGSYVVVGPGPESRVIAVASAIGIVTTYNGGRSWQWVCEESLGLVGMFDPSIAIGFGGNIVLDTPTGLLNSHSGCAWSAPPGSPTRAVVDIASDATGRRMVTAIGPTGSDDQLMLSSDGGATWTPGARLLGFFTETVEIAPSRPSRIYVSGFLSGGITVLLRSDDGGMSVREITRDFLGGAGAYVSGVDPNNADVLYVRTSTGLGSLLLRSDDGGGSFRMLTRTDFPMVGFALSDDGNTVWAASSDRREGILRSEHGGVFRRVSANVSPSCLRYHGGVLYVCANEAVDGFVLGCSTNGGDRIDPLLSMRLLSGPSPSCGASTPVGMLCPDAWITARMTLASVDAGALPTLVIHDATVPDTGVDAPPVLDIVDIPDVAVDGGHTSDAGDVLDESFDDGALTVRDTSVVASPDGADVTRDASTRMLSDQASTIDGAGPSPRGCTCHAGECPSRRGAFTALTMALLAFTRRRKRSS